MQSNANVTERITEWQNVNWQEAFSAVKNLRQRIFRASDSGNWKKVRSLQKLMLRSHSNTLVAVRRVTQVNKGKRTPGVDKLVVKTPVDRGILVEILEILVKYAFLWEPHPVRRTYILKASGKKRPLGIPSIVDRCLQAIVKNSLEPAYEAHFEGTSYGFRPGRSSHDALGKIYLIARPNKNKKWVLEVDYEGCFDNIAHEPLMKAIGNFPGRKLIHQWLKAGYVDNGTFHDSDKGTPQGGIISPLLANIALHGMEEALTVYKTLKNGKRRNTKEGVSYSERGTSNGKRQMVRYADDYVVFCETKEDAEECHKILTDWSKERGLSLSKEKTRITHLSEGFNFLGFNIRQYKVNNTKTGWKLLIKPSAEKLQEIRRELKQKWLKLKGQSVGAIIKELNPYIRGTANYLRPMVSSEAFSGLDNYIFQREKRYANRMHPGKNNEWKKKRYWGNLDLDREDNWMFGDKKSGKHIIKYSHFKIERHVMVTGISSPDDPTLKEYWENRTREKARELTPSRQKVAKRQDFKCRTCGQTLFNDEELHLHHKKPKSVGGKDTYSNLELVHLYCHQQIHARMGLMPIEALEEEA